MRPAALVKNALRRMGWDAHRYSADSDAANRRQRLLAYLDVSVVLDVGANVGQYGVNLRENGYRGRIVSFEPLRQAFGKLASTAARDGNWEAHNCALGDFDGDAEFYVTENSVSSSLLRVTDRPETRLQGLSSRGRETVRVRRLDSIAADIIPDAACAYLKADVQGAEQRLISGASNTLPRVRAIELELSTVRIYEHQPLYLELATMLDGAGFNLSSVEPVFVDGPTGRMLQFDGIFVARNAMDR